tara:strand:- start:58095 stop:58349 length:255 start_codon:yes stop_codon:yes gene_type:complete
MSTIRLGVRAKDKITGFTGIVMGKAEWLTGCDQVALKPPVSSDGSMRDASWFDIGAVEYIDEGINAKEVASNKPGGPNKDVPIC